MWDKFSPPSSEFLESLENIKPDPSPPKVTMTETEFITKLQVLPITPVSTKPISKFAQELPVTAKELPISLKGSVNPLSPESPIRSVLGMEGKFLETISAESSLRLAIPEIPSSSRKDTFPSTVFGIFIAEEDLRCDALAKSIIDFLNDEIKWIPFTKASRTMDSWPEEVEGDWETFVDYTGFNYDDETIVLTNTFKIENDEVLDKWEPHPQTEPLKEDFMELMDLVKKRKLSQNGRDTGFKRSKWSQKNRIQDFMASRGREVLETSDDEVAQKIMIRNSFKIH
jgi:hypothetical protein